MSTAEAREALDWTDRILELDIGPVAHGGHCVARSGGRVVFVRHALPGERVRAVVSEDGGGSFCRADAVAVLQPAPQRVRPACVWARAGGCGGCDLQHVDPAEQRAWKAAVLAEQLQRLAGIEWTVPVEELPGGPLGWRSRLRLAVDAAGRAGLRAHRSHDVLPIADCPLAPPGVLPPVLERGYDPTAVIELEVATDADGVTHVGDDGPVVQRAVGREWRLSPGVFWQVHPALPDTLATVLGEWVEAPSGGLAWDLFGGVGLFAAVLAEQVGPTGEVTVVESSRPAVADGRAALADLPQVRWRVGRVEDVLGNGEPSPSRGRHAPSILPGFPDVVVVDPPRRGLGRGLVDALAARAPRQVLYVACDPAALARDLALFAGHGYQPDALRAFDAFPMTHHFETVARLRRR